MTTLAGTGISYDKKNSFNAGVEAAKKALEEMGASTPDFIFLFSTDVFNQKKLLAGVRSITGKTPLAGCCTAGLFFNNLLSTEVVGVLALQSDDLKFITAIEHKVNKKQTEVGKDLGRKISKGLQKLGVEKGTVVLLPDGIEANIQKIVENVYSVLGARFKLVGGGAGDNLKFSKTYQFLNDKVYTKSVVAVAINDLPSAVGVKHGWQPAGKLSTVTRAEGNVVHEINGISAFDYYRHYLHKKHPKLNASEFGKVAMSYPIGIPKRTGEYIIRDPINASETGALTCVGEVMPGTVIRIMKGTRDPLFAAAKEAATEARNKLGGREPAVALLFDCVSRVLLYGEKDAKLEIKAIRGAVGKAVPLIGFYSFGEIGAIYGPPAFHNKTAAIYIIPE